MMPTVAYIANEFPSPAERYVGDEIRELRGRGVRVFAYSLRRPQRVERETPALTETSFFQPFCFRTLLAAAWLCLRKWKSLFDLLIRISVKGNEPFSRRFRAGLHTLLGAYFALLLKDTEVEHIHAHHGYAASWVAMVAARLLGISYSMTLHGSDLLVHQAYLDVKLKHCKFCMTVSDFNRHFILEHYPGVAASKVIVQRLGVRTGVTSSEVGAANNEHRLVMLSAGRLHPVKDHAFLVQACRRLKDRSLPFLCLIAGDGPERRNLERLITELDLRHEVSLLGHVPYQRLEACYSMCDLVVLTSRSEGIPLVLMEAMAHGRTVLAPCITGIPELVENGRTGFLYQPGSIEDFVERVEMISRSRSALAPVRRAARRHVLAHFNREWNLAAFADTFIAQITGSSVSKAA